MVEEPPLINFDTPLFGRDRELDQIQEALARTRLGQGSTIFISGEAGVGKTRLVDEFLATADDCLILRGWCLPELVEPLLPIREALRSGGLEESFTGINPPRLLSVFLVSPSGLLVARSEKEESGLDPEIFTGMLKAVSSFVKDTLSAMQGESLGGGLSSLGYEGYKIILESSSSEFTLVSILSGNENEKFLFDSRDLLRGILNDHWDILESWSGEVATVAPILTRLERFTASSKFIGRELVTDDPKLRHENLLDNILLGMRRVSQERTTILYLDDCQWADPSSLGVIHYLARNTRKHPILIMGTYRPEDLFKDREGKTHPFSEMIDLMGREGLQTVIELPRLGHDSVAGIVRSSLGDFAGEDEVSAYIHQQSEGNSFFAKEVLKSLVEEGVLAYEGRWKIAGDLDSVKVTDHILEVVNRRLKRLSEEDRELLHCASVVGAEFGSQVIACSLGQNRLKVTQRLGQIERLHSLIHSIDHQYRFDHAKIRQVLYDGMAADLRALYHSAIAECYLTEHAADPLRVKFELSYHLDRAGDARAYDFALAAAEESRAAFATDEARRQYRIALPHCQDPERMAAISEGLGDIGELEASYQDALALWKQASAEYSADEDNARLLRKRSEALRKQARYHDAIAMAKEAFARAPDGSLEQVRARYSETEALWRIGAYDETQRIIEALLELDMPERDRGKGLHSLGTVLSLKGDMDLAMGQFEKAMVIWERDIDPRGRSATLNNIGLIHSHRGDLVSALEYQERSLAIDEEIGDKAGIAISLNNIGIINSSRGDLELALDYQERSLAIREEIGVKSGIGTSLGNLGNIHEDRGDLELALEYQERSLAIREEIGSKAGIGNTLNNIGNIHRERGDLELALEYQERSLAILQEIGDKSGICHSLHGLAEVRLDRGEVDLAESLNARTLDLAQEIGQKVIQGPALVLRGRLKAARGEDFRKDLEASLDLSEEGSKKKAKGLYRFAELLIGTDPPEAHAHLEKAREIFTKIGNPLWLSRIDGLEKELGPKDRGNLD